MHVIRELCASGRPSPGNVMNTTSSRSLHSPASNTELRGRPSVIIGAHFSPADTATLTVRRCHVMPPRHRLCHVMPPSGRRYHTLSCNAAQPQTLSDPTAPSQTLPVVVHHTDRPRPNATTLLPAHTDTYRYCRVTSNQCNLKEGQSPHTYTSHRHGHMPI